MRSVAAAYLHVLYGNLCRLFKIERESLVLGRRSSIGEQLAPGSRLRFIPYCYRLSLSRGLGAARGSPTLRTWRLQAEPKLPARILIVDDNSIARTTIRGLLDWHSFQVCGEAQDGRDAITKVTELRPDIVILDINMPGMNGINAAYEIRRISPSTKIVFLTIHSHSGSEAQHSTVVTWIRFQVRGRN